MSKDPAFLFYSQDFTIGTQFFTDEQVGKYIRLLSAQHQHGHLSELQVNYICRTYDDTIMSKFVKDEDGKYYNARLEEEIKKRKSFCNSRRKNISKRYDVGKNSTSVDTYVLHMENENENENNNINGVENFKKIISDAKELCVEFFNAEEWIEWVLQSQISKQLNIEKNDLKKYIIEFIEEQRIIGKLDRGLKDYKDHFYKWYRIQLNKHEK